MGRAYCQWCEYLTVPYYGPDDAKIFLIGEAPGWEEQEKGMPFVGDTGDILRQELKLLGGIDFLDCRVGNLWLHERNKVCNPDNHAESLLKEMGKHPYFLMMGSEFGDVFYPAKTMDFNGRRINVGKSKGIITVNPAMLPKDSVGEFRYALDRFKRLVEGDNIEQRAFVFRSIRTRTANPSRKARGGVKSS